MTKYLIVGGELFIESLERQVNKTIEDASNTWELWPCGGPFRDNGGLWYQAVFGGLATTGVERPSDNGVGR